MSTVEREAAELIRTERWAALATLTFTVMGARVPQTSMVAYAIADGSLIFHVSRLAAHTRAMIGHPVAALAVSRPDRGDGDPQELPRVLLQGRVTLLERGSPAEAEAAHAYVARLPAAADRLQLGDFLFVRFTPLEVRYVGGFAQAATLKWSDVAKELLPQTA
jgi:heme iron utilization protein